MLQHLDVLHHVASLTRATAVGWEMKSQTLTSKTNRLERSPQTSSWQNAGHFLGTPMHQVVVELFESFKILHWEKPSLKSNWAMGHHINCQIGHSWNNHIAKCFQPWLCQGIHLGLQPCGKRRPVRLRHPALLGQGFQSLVAHELAILRTEGGGSKN